MGYYTRVTGELRIEPPLTWAEFKDSPFLQGGPNDDTDYNVCLKTTEETVDTDDGQLVRDGRAVKIEPRIVWPDEA